MARLAAGDNNLTRGRRVVKAGGNLGGLAWITTRNRIDQTVLAELLARQGDAETARRTMTEAAAKLRALDMQWHAAQADRWLETGTSISRY